MPKFHSRLYYLEKHKVTLDGSGDGSKSVTFESSFVGTPKVTVVKPKGDSGTYTATSVTNSSFTITITSSDLTSQDVEVFIFAIEYV